MRLPRGATHIDLLPLHSGLTSAEQLRVFEPAEKGSRKIIVATNIAEVSMCVVTSVVMNNSTLGEYHDRRHKICDR